MGKKCHSDSIAAKFVEYLNSETDFDFHGNLREISVAFIYRIYDEKLPQEIQDY